MRGVVPAFAVVRGGRADAPVRSASQQEIISVRETTSAEPPAVGPPFTNEPTWADAYWRHPSFERALHGLLDDIRRRSAPVVVLTGAAGTGKTLLVHCALRKAGGDAIPVFQGHPHATFESFLFSVCRQLGLAASGSEGGMEAGERFDLLWTYLRAQAEQGRHLVVFYDNAQDMSEALLEELAQPSRWTESGRHMLQLVLVGQPSLHAVVRKLVQRELIAEDYPRYGLAPLQPDEARAFVSSRLAQCGVERAQHVARETLDKIADYSQGIPRLMLTLCSLAAFHAWLDGRSVLTPELIDQVANSAMIDGHAQHPGEVEIEEEVRCEPRAHPRLAPVPSTITTQEERPMTRLDDLNKILKNLQNRSPGIEASALISEDGLMIASALSPELDDTRVGGMTATLLSLGTRAATELHRGEVREVIVRGDDGYAVMVSAGRGTLLLVLTTEDTKLGLIFFDMREAIKGINKVL
jgi:predicted regulator of Ras-like GTPase activity (Roadblock/LC7/MglB family)/type II secretory pathway predicted ATPase ExeA